MASKHAWGLLTNDDQYIVWGSNFLLTMTSLLLHDVLLTYVFYSSVESLGPYAHIREKTYFFLIHINPKDGGQNWTLYNRIYAEYGGTLMTSHDQIVSIFYILI